MKAYAIKVADPNNPQLGQGEDPALYLAPPTNIMHILRCKDPRKRVDGSKHLNKSSIPSLTGVP
jgi:hypothetical protein